MALTTENMALATENMSLTTENICLLTGYVCSVMFLKYINSIVRNLKEFYIAIIPHYS